MLKAVIGAAALWALGSQAAFGQAAAPAPAAPAVPDVPGAAQPSGKWAVDYGDDNCSIARQYGEGADQFFTAMRTMPGEMMVQMVVMHHPALTPTAAQGFGTLSMLPKNKSARMSYADTATTGGSYERAMQGFVSRFEILDLPTSTALKLTFGDKQVFFQPRGLAAANKALEACEDDLLTKLGYDAKALRDLKIPPFPSSDARTWFTKSDFKGSMEAKKGPARVRWTIDVDGKIKDCKVITSSGSPEFDAAACAAYLKHAHYNPAQDSNGKPVAMPMVQQTF